MSAFRRGIMSARAPITGKEILIYEVDELTLKTDMGRNASIPATYPKELVVPGTLIHFAADYEISIDEVENAENGGSVQLRGDYGLNYTVAFVLPNCKEGLVSKGHLEFVVRSDRNATSDNLFQVLSGASATSKCASTWKLTNLRITDATAGIDKYPDVVFSIDNFETPTKEPAGGDAPCQLNAFRALILTEISVSIPLRIDGVFEMGFDCRGMTNDSYTRIVGQYHNFIDQVTLGPSMKLTKGIDYQQYGPYRISDYGLELVNTYPGTTYNNNFVCFSRYSTNGAWTNHIKIQDLIITRR